MQKIWVVKFKMQAKENPLPFTQSFQLGFHMSHCCSWNWSIQGSAMVPVLILSFGWDTNSSTSLHLVLPGLVSSCALWKGKFPRLCLCQDFREQDACKFYFIAYT